VKQSDNTTSKSKPKTGLAVIIAFVVALVILVTVILPAEFGVDPLRTGQLLGLNQLAAGSTDANITQHMDHAEDYVEFILEPFQSLEYKYHMDAGAAMVYTWRADGEVYFDFHSEDATREDYEESFDAGDAEHRQGVFVAPFPGIHGWFWENRSFDEIVLRFAASGFFREATEYRDGGTADRQLRSVLD